MAAGKKLPGVDKEALAGLAQQFPRTQGWDDPGGRSAPEAAGPSFARDDQMKAVSTAEPDSSSPREPDRRGVGRPDGGDGPARTSPDSGQATSAPVEGSAVPREPIVAPHTTTQPRPAVSSSGGHARTSLSLVIGLVALAVALVALAPLLLGSWLPSRSEESPLVQFFTGNRAALEARLQEFAASLQASEDSLTVQAARLDAIETSASSPAFSAEIAGRMEETAKESAEMARRLATLESDLPERLNRIEAGLGAIEASTAKSAKLYLIALQLRILSQTPEPFAEAVEAATALGFNDEQVTSALQVLARYGADGVATLAQLEDRFLRQVAPRLRSADSLGNASLFLEFRTWFNSFFLSEGGRTMPSERVAVIISLAEQDLARDRLRRASEHLERLEGAHARAALPWLTQARARLAVDDATATLLSGAFDLYVATED